MGESDSVTSLLRVVDSTVLLTDAGRTVMSLDLAADASAEDWTNALEGLASSAPGGSWTTTAVEPCGGLVALGADGVPVRPPILPNDERAVPDSGWCLKKFDAEWWTAHTGGMPTPERTVCKLSWLHRSEADAWSSMARVCTVSDWLRWLMSGAAPNLDRLATDAVSAIHTGLWSPTEMRYSEQACRLIDTELDWSTLLPGLRD